MRLSKEGAPSSRSCQLTGARSPPGALDSKAKNASRKLFRWALEGLGLGLAGGGQPCSRVPGKERR